MATIPQKELRNDVSEVLRRAEGGERIVVTVSGRPVASLGPIRDRQWVRTDDLGDLATVAPDPNLRKDLEGFEASLTDRGRAGPEAPPRHIGSDRGVDPAGT